MEATQLASEVRKWLVDSGVLREMHASLRAKMIHRILDKSKEKKDSAESKKRVCGARQSAFNSLVLEFLSRSRRWYSAAVLAREADGEFAAGRTRVAENGDAETEKLSEEQLEAVLAALQWPRRLNNDSLRVSYYGRKEKSLLEAILDGADAAASVKNTENDIEIYQRLEAVEKAISSSAGANRPIDSASVKRKVERLRRSVETSLSESTVTTRRSSRTRSASPSRRNSNSRSESSEVEDMRRRLRAAHEELELAKEASRAEAADLRTIIRLQQEELERLREDIPVDAKPVDQEPPPRRETPADEGRDVGRFVRQVRSRVDLLYQNSTSIDREFSSVHTA